MGYEPMACALALQCSTQLSHEDPFIGSRPISWVHLNPWMEWNNEDDVNRWNTNLNEDMIVAVVIKV